MPFTIPRKMIKFHNIYKALCFKTMAQVDILILLFKELKGFPAKSYMADCQSKGPHPKGLSSFLRKKME